MSPVPLSGPGTGTLKRQQPTELVLADSLADGYIPREEHLERLSLLQEKQDQ